MLLMLLPMFAVSGTPGLTRARRSGPVYWGSRGSRTSSVVHSSLLVVDCPAFVFRYSLFVGRPWLLGVWYSMHGVRCPVIVRALCVNRCSLFVVHLLLFVLHPPFDPCFSQEFDESLTLPCVTDSENYRNLDESLVGGEGNCV